MARFPFLSFPFLPCREINYREPAFREHVRLFFPGTFVFSRLFVFRGLDGESRGKSQLLDERGTLRGRSCKLRFWNVLERKFSKGGVHRFHLWTRGVHLTRTRGSFNEQVKLIFTSFCANKPFCIEVCYLRCLYLFTLLIKIPRMEKQHFSDFKLTR